jgi:hypothetical protein
LISFSRRLVSDQGAAAFGIASVRIKITEVIGQHMKLERHSVGGEGPA